MAGIDGERLDSFTGMIRVLYVVYPVPNAVELDPVPHLLFAFGLDDLCVTRVYGALAANDRCRVAYGYLIIHLLSPCSALRIQFPPHQ